MKLVLNIEKRHLIFFSLFLVLVGSVFVIAIGENSPNKVFHADLYTDKILKATGIGSIIVNSPLDIITNANYNYITLKGITYSGIAVKEGDLPPVGYIRWNNNDDKWEIFAGGGNANNIKMSITDDGKIIIPGQICKDTNNCKPVSEIIATIEDTTEETTFTNPKKDNYFIKADDVSATQYCKEETDYPTLINYRGEACGNTDYDFKFYIIDTLNPGYTGWRLGSCLNTAQKITSITCERDVEPEEPEEIEVSSGLGANFDKTGETTCLEGKVLIGLGREFLGNGNYRAYLICK